MEEDKSLMKAKNLFKNTLKELNEIGRRRFLRWIQDQITMDVHDDSEHTEEEECKMSSPTGTACGTEVCKSMDKSVGVLERIANDLLNFLPFDGIVESETIHLHDACGFHGHAGVDPPESEIQDSTSNHEVHIDAFLYDDTALDSLIDEGKLGRHYCADCSSRNIKDLTFISHSISTKQMKFLFCEALPQVIKNVDLNKKVLLDVGSRIGAVLFGGYFLSSMKKLIGVEMNKELCDIQQTMINKYSMSDRITVHHSDIKDCKDLLQTADIIVLHNVFEYFLPQEEQIRVWLFLRDAITRKDTVLITVPSLEESMSFDENLLIKVNIPQWLEPINIKYDETLFEDDEELADIQTMHFYKVKFSAK